MTDLQERIRKLELKLENLGLSLKKITEKVETITDKNLLEELKLKEKELESYRTQLLTYQSEKEQISKELNLEVKKVINSNLSNEEKSKQIIEITAENQKQFAETCQHLSNAWQSYHQIQQNIIAVLESKSQGEQAAIKRLENTKHNQFIINGVLLAVIVLFLFTLLFRQANQSAPKNNLPTLNEE